MLLQYKLNYCHFLVKFTKYEPNERKTTFRQTLSPSFLFFTSKQQQQQQQQQQQLQILLIDNL
jgi:hypothetical protein